METGIPWSDILPYAVGVALSPVPVTAVILTLFSRHPRRNGLVFLAGWVSGLVVIAAFCVLLAIVSSPIERATQFRAAAGIRLLFGIFFVLLAFWQWRRRPRAGEERPLPAWTARIETITAVQALLLALGLCIINPKNFALTLAVTLSITEVEFLPRQTWLDLWIYILLGSVSIAIPVLYRVLAGARADSQLTATKRWLMANNTIVVVAVFLLIGIMLVGKGLQGIW
jgi:hypothetical protein